MKNPKAPLTLQNCIDWNDKNKHPITNRQIKIDGAAYRKVIKNCNDLWNTKFESSKKKKVIHSTSKHTSSPWIQHIKNVAAEKGLSYKDAMKIAKESYKHMKEPQALMFNNPPKETRNMFTPERITLRTIDKPTIQYGIRGYGTTNNKKMICEQWRSNKNKNPRTGKSIKNTGKVYKDLQRECELIDVKQTELSDVFKKSDIINSIENLNIPINKLVKLLDILTLNPSTLSTFKKLKNVKANKPEDFPVIEEQPPLIEEIKTQPADDDDFYTIESMRKLAKETVKQHKKKGTIFDEIPTSLNSIIKTINVIMNMAPKLYRNNLDSINNFFYNITKNQDYDYARNIINARKELDFVYTPDQCLLKFKEVVETIKDARNILEPTAGMGHMVNIINTLNTNPSTRIYVNDLYKPFSELLKAYDPFTQNRLFVDNINFISEESFKYLDIPIDTIISNPPYTKQTDKLFYYDFLFRYLYLLINNTINIEKSIIFISPELAKKQKRISYVSFEDILESIPRNKLVEILRQYEKVDNNFLDITLPKIKKMFSSGYDTDLADAVIRNFEFRACYNLGLCEGFTTTKIKAYVYLILVY